MKKIDKENFIFVYENAFPKEYCEKVIEHYENMCEAGFCQNRQQAENTSKLKKDDSFVFLNSEPVLDIKSTKELSKEFNDQFWSVYYTDYANQFNILNDFEKHFSYNQKVQKTKIGGGYHVWHCETGANKTANRILVWTLYLNDVEEGGETEYLYQNLRVKAKQGTLVIWPAGFTHTHRGNPPLSNEKYIMTGWVEF